jgi:hypothetical protein
MYYRPKILIVPLLLIFLIIFSCRKKEDYSIIPEIKFENFVWISDTNIIGIPALLTISFTDGDGDIGTFDGKPGEPDLFITYFEKQYGIWTDTVLGDHFKYTVQNYNSQISKIAPVGKNKNLKGEIQFKFGIMHYSNFDTIRFQIYIVDRALHKSNVIYTPDIIIK